MEKYLPSKGDTDSTAPKAGKGGKMDVAAE
jgi:hypothetical protein